MNRPRVLVLGSGFAAFSLLKGLDARAADVTVVSPRNKILVPLDRQLAAVFGRELSRM